MKTIGTIAALIIAFNLVALIINLLFSNPITGALTMATAFTLPFIIGYKLLNKRGK